MIVDEAKSPTCLSKMLIRFNPKLIQLKDWPLLIDMEKAFVDLVDNIC